MEKLRNVLRDSLVYGLSAVLSRFMGVFITPIYTRIITPEQFGILDLVTTTTAIFFIIAETSMSSGYMRFFYDAKDVNGLSKLKGSIILYYLASFSFLFFLFFVLKDRIGEMLNINSKWITVSILCVLPQQVSSLNLVNLRMRKRALRFLIVSVGQIMLAVILSLTCVFYLHLDVWGIILGLVVSTVVFGLISYLMLATDGDGFTWRLSYVKQCLHYSVPIVPSLLGNWAILYINRIYIIKYLSLETLGIYSIASKIANLMMIVVFAFRQVFEPYAVKLFSEKKSEDRFVVAFDVFALLMLVTYIVFVLLVPLSLRLFAPAQYASAAPLIPFISGGIIIAGWSTVLASGANWEKKTKYISYGNIAGSILTIGILAVLRGVGGVVVVALLFWLASLVRTFFVYYLAQTVHYIPYSIKGIVGFVIAYFIFAAVPFGEPCIGFNKYAFVALNSVAGLGVITFAFYFLVGDQFRILFYRTIIRR